MPVEKAKRLFDVDEYHRMAQGGILSEDGRVELIDGEIVAMTPIGPRHNASVDRAIRSLVTTVGDGAIVRVQGSVELDRFREPQPDIVLLRPQADFYASHLPGPARHSPRHRDRRVVAGIRPRREGARLRAIRDSGILDRGS